MDSFELKNIVDLIMQDESIDLTALAKKANGDRSYLSKLVNSKKKLKVGPKIEAKIKKAFPGYFPENNTNNITKIDDQAMQILNLLAKAYDKQAETINIQTGILEGIKKEMARELTQARIESNLQKVFGGLETIGDRQGHAIKQILLDLDELKRRRNDP